MIISTPIGKLTFIFYGQKLKQIVFGEKEMKSQKNGLEKEVLKQIQEYFLGKRKTFDLPCVLEGTDFQTKVWKALEKIPFGQTLTYQALAKQLKTSARAIGHACRNNPLPVLIPCHRVVAKNGLGGFSGQIRGRMLNIKKALLDLEMSTHARYGNTPRSCVCDIIIPD